MVTLKNIAAEAGVSYGTVSNVLNGRGNVSTQKIQLVEQAARKLGYRINTRAQMLRQGKGNTIALIIPGTEYPAYAEVYEVLQQELLLQGYSVLLFSTHALETAEMEALESAVAARVSAIVTVSCLRDASKIYQQEVREIPVIFLDRSDCSCAHSLFAGFHAQQAGCEIATHCLRKHYQTLALFTSVESASMTQAFLSGFRSVLPSLSIATREISCSEQQLDLRAFELFESGASFDCIICTDSLRLHAAKVAFSYAQSAQSPQFISIAPRAALPNCNAVHYELDYKQLAHQIVKTLISHLEEHAPLPKQIQWENSGFRQSLSPCTFADTKLRFLTVASPSSVAISRLLPHFRKRTGIDVQMTVLGLDELFDVLHDDPHGSGYDLIRMDMAWISELAPLIYRPLSKINHNFQELLNQMRPEFLTDYTSAGHVQYCLPLDPSTQILFYRRDLLESPSIKRMYYESTHNELLVPRTFEEYNQIARFFTRSFNPQSPVKFGSTVAIGNAVVTPSEYMPRLFSAGGSLFDSHGKIRLLTKEALSALQNYKETYEYSDKTIYQWWKSALEGFADGSAAMTVVFLNHASDIINSKMSSIAGKIGFSTVPGGKPLIGGGVIGLHRDSANEQAACCFLDWLYSDEIAPVFTMLGGLSPCNSVYSNRDIYEKYPWLSAAKRSFPIGQRRATSEYYTNFSEKKLERILSLEVKNAVMGIISPEDALSRVQQQCDRIFIPRASY